MRYKVPATSTLILTVGAVAASFALGSGGAAASDEVVFGKSVASVSWDKGFEGYWKYCLTISWDVSKFGGKPQDLSHISMLLGLESCLRACTSGYFAFPDTAGSNTTSEGCVVHYYVEFDCKGDPTIPDQVPTIKFEPYSGACEPGTSGTATMCFYSLAPPKPTTTSPSSVWIKFGLNVASGSLEGALPNCISPTNPVEESTWGAIKSLLD